MDTFPTEVEDLAAALAPSEGMVLFGSGSPRHSATRIPNPIEIVLNLLVLPATLALLEVAGSTASLVSIQPPPVVSTVIVQVTHPVFRDTGGSGTVVVFFSTQVSYCTVVQLKWELLLWNMANNAFRLNCNNDQILL